MQITVPNLPTLLVRFTATVASLLLVAVAAAPSLAQQPTYGQGYPQQSYPQTPGPLVNQAPASRIAAAPNNLSPGQTATATQTGASQPGDPTSLSADPSETGEGTESSASIQIGNIISIIREGGVLMIPIMLCSIVLMVFVFERLVFLRRSRVIPRPFVRGVLEQLEQQQLEKEDAIALCDENGSAIAELFSGALKKWGRPAVEVEQAVMDAGERVTSELRKYLRMFNAISNLTPLLGLLGTVLGMIDAFNTIASADAMGRPELLASGIGAALLTTAAGLCVAIPAYAAFAFFVGKADQLTLEMDQYAQSLVDAISAEALQETGSRSRSRSRRAA
ncbi:MAG: hypothetical protein Aurels2KO_04550 [Aureliella sp.]